jgi:4-hydroxy-tetrahydrodipicolinate synthase
MAMGGKGVISVVSNVVPADMAALTTAMEKGNWGKAREFHFKMESLIDSLFIETNPIPVKAALAMMGKIQYDLRLPLCKMSEANYEKLRKVMVNYGLIR